jgi:hypothetical protein
VSPEGQYCNLFTIIVWKENGGKVIQKDTKGKGGRNKAEEDKDMKEMILP